MKILHVLDHSLPMLDGYAVRSKHILEGQFAAGLDVAAVTAHMRGVELPSEHEISGVRYFRTLPANPNGFLARLPLISFKVRQSWLARRLSEVVRSFRPDLIHCHSPVLYGIPAQEIASGIGVPFVYEVRCFWEDAAHEQGKYREGSLKYRLVQRLETGLLRKATAAVAICQGLRDEIVERGVPAERVIVAPNAVDAELFVPMPRNDDLAEELGVSGRVVIGYIGSFFGFEGVELLVGAAGQIIQQAPDVSVVIVGGGKNEDSIREAVVQANLPADRLILTGRVPFEQVIDYYSLMDVLVYPRLSLRVTELVTPLKPLEAMAMGKAVVGSRVGGIAELVEDGRTGLLFEPGDAADLARTCSELANAQERRHTLGEAAREYVLRQRQWPAVIPRYVELYERLLRA